jgi:tetratricopeptide (TPR) repeat protein
VTGAAAVPVPVAVASSPPAPSTPSFSTYNPQTFAGREAETADLTARLGGSCRVLAITGMTGVGKTALAERVVAKVMATAATASFPYYRFSLDTLSLTPEFANSGAALLRTLGEEPTLADQQDPANLLAHVLQRLCRQPCRVQIDSLERLLRGNEQEGWSEFCDPLWLDLLHQFLAGSECPSQLLLTSQDIPADLDTMASRYPQFWHCQTLQGLTVAEQRGLFLKLGLPQDAASLAILDRIGAFYDGHPLVLQVIADEIRQPPFQGNIARYWQHYQADFTSTPPSPTSPSSTSLTRSRLFRRRVRQRVEQTLHRLPDPARRMLCASAVFRRPVPVAFWQAMLPDDDSQSAFEALQDRHLVEFTADAEGIPLVRQHNLIRSVTYDMLKADRPTWHAAECQAAHLWLTAYAPAPDAPNLETVRGYLEAFDHYCEVEDWETAKSILMTELNTPTRDKVYWQLGIWGYNREQIPLCQRILGKLDARSDGIWLNTLGLAYRNLGDYQRAIDSAHKQLAISREIGNRRGEGNALNHLGLTYYSLGQYERAIDFYQQYLTISREMGNRQGEGTALNHLGLTYYRLGQYERAIDLYQQRLTISREIGDRRVEGAALGNLGLAYYSLGQYERAIYYHQQDLNISKENGDLMGQGEALGNLGLSYCDFGHHERAIECHQEYLIIAREIGDRYGEGTALGNLGLTHYYLRQYADAFDCQQKYLVIARAIGDRHGEAVALDDTGATQIKLGKYADALVNIQLALEIFREIGSRGGEAEALKNLAELHQALGEGAVARQYCQQALALATELGIPLAAECEALQLKMQN